ncbi:efflux RND transporter periplasmic adaptor subunit [Paracoccus sp. (in: a-proteobacteria)]|uniref:efflux RND transporter periplasmic adaptor subunit n=1 Tax=Paracoccus sp. TaxID=267 RepID=UPI0032200C40
MPRQAAILFLLFLPAQPAWSEIPLRVEFVRVERAPLTYEAALTGTIQAADSVEVGFRLGGRVQDVLVHEGDRVTGGQALAQIDPLQQQQALRVAQAAVASAEAAEAQGRQAVGRAEAMLARGVGTRAALDASMQAMSAASGALAQARSALGQAERALEDTLIRAPHDAIVTARRAEPGQIVAPAQSVLSLASATGREAVFQTPDTPFLRQAIGAAVSLTAIDLPATEMRARVTEIAPLIDPATGSVTVRALIENAPANIGLLGAAVRGAVHYPAGQGFAIPWTALTNLGKQPAVWRVGKDGRVALVPVQIKRFGNGTVILGAGVEPGQTVVGAGAQLLYPGRLVADGDDGGQG